MENKTVFRFRKTRDFGDLLSDTFKFIRENYKNFFVINFKICAPFLIALILSNAYYTYVTIGTGFGDLMGGGFLVPMLINFLALFVYITALYLSVFHYIKSYVANDGKVNEEDIRDGIKQQLGSALVLEFLVWIITFVGLVFILVPGIYLGVVLSLALPIMVFEGKGIGDSFSDSFSLIRDNWWFTFGVLIVFGIIMYVINVVFQMPMIVYMIINMISGVDAGIETMAQNMENKDPIMVVLTILASIAQYLLYIVTPIFIALIYFNLHEEKNFTGTYETIDNLGKDRE